MKYLNTNHYNPPNLPKNRPVWAVAYDIDNDTGHVRLSCKPTLGEVVSSSEIKASSLWSNYIFVPYKKGTHTRCKSGFVSCGARMYADTYEEAVDIYNSLVQKRVDKLEKMKNEAVSDFIINFPTEEIK